MQQPWDCSSAFAALLEGRDPSASPLPTEPDLPGSFTLVPQEACTTPVWIKAQVYPCHNILRKKTRELLTAANRKKCYTCRAQTLPLIARLLYNRFVNMTTDREDRDSLWKPGKIVRYFPCNCKDVNVQSIEAAEIGLWKHHQKPGKHIVDKRHPTTFSIVLLFLLLEIYDLFLGFIVSGTQCLYPTNIICKLSQISRSIFRWTFQVCILSSTKIILFKVWNKCDQTCILNTWFQNIQLVLTSPSYSYKSQCVFLTQLDEQSLPRYWVCDNIYLDDLSQNLASYWWDSNWTINLLAFLFFQECFGY